MTRPRFERGGVFFVIHSRTRLITGGNAQQSLHWAAGKVTWGAARSYPKAHLPFRGLRHGEAWNG
jgi:hypothetical protein